MPSIADLRKMTDDEVEDYSESGEDPSARERAAEMLKRRIAKQMASASKDTAVYTSDLARYTRAIARGTIALFIVTGLSLIVQLILAFLKK